MIHLPQAWVGLPACIFAYLPVSLPDTVCQWHRLPKCLSVSLLTCPSFCLSACMFAFPSVWFCLPACLLTWLPLCLCLSVYFGGLAIVIVIVIVTGLVIVQSQGKWRSISTETQRPPGYRKGTQTAVVWSFIPFIRSSQIHLARHSERGKKTRQAEGEVGRQHQRMDRPGAPPSLRGQWRPGKMEETGCEINCGAPTTLAVKE